jgi:hypothetical protein
MKMKRIQASIIVDSLTYFFVIMLMLATMSRMPVRIMVYAPSGINEVSIPR